MHAIQSIIAEALGQPPTAIAYFISQRLRSLYPTSGLLETEDADFNLDGYAAEGYCLLSARPSVHHQMSTFWNATTNQPFSMIEEGWLEVEWQDQHLHVLRVTWSNEGCTNRRSWIIAATQAAATALFSAVSAWNSEVRDEILVFQDGYWAKDEDLFLAIKNATLEGLVLQDTLKEDIYADASQFFAAQATYARYKIPWKRGILLIGPPGNGKTHTVKSLINALGKPCLYVKSFVSEYGSSHHNIRQAFERAREMLPCLLVLEDLDSLITEDNRSFFLNEVDGFAANEGIMIIATTNHPERIDPAILNRPSRFDRKYYFELPAIQERLSYIKLWNQTLEPALRLSDVGLREVAEATDGFSFAYLKELFLSSMMAWINGSHTTAIDSLMLAQIASLHEQINAATEPIT